MRFGMRVLGAALSVLGAVWILQGVGLLEGSFMTGQAFWFWMGALALAAGMSLLLRGLRRG
jgi:membrane protein implicated in regulation of membrane protease activity